MNYCQIIDCDVANGPGLRVSLFVSGCTHHCPGCFNEVAWDKAYGKPWTPEDTQRLLKMLDRPYIQGLTLLGGEPMELYNQDSVWDIIKAVREKFPDKDIWLYSGYTFEQLTGKIPCLDADENSRCRGPHTDEILSGLNVLVDGPFILDEKDITLKFRGSHNQRVLYMTASLHEEAPVWMEEYK